jgi:hypothetical protein
MSRWTLPLCAERGGRRLITIGRGERTRRQWRQVQWTATERSGTDGLGVVRFRCARAACRAGKAPRSVPVAGWRAFECLLLTYLLVFIRYRVEKRYIVSSIYTYPSLYSCTSRRWGEFGKPPGDGRTAPAALRAVLRATSCPARRPQGGGVPGPQCSTKRGANDIGSPRTAATR